MPIGMQVCHVSACNHARTVQVYIDLQSFKSNDLHIFSRKLMNASYLFQVNYEYQVHYFVTSLRCFKFFPQTEMVVIFQRRTYKKLFKLCHNTANKLKSFPSTQRFVFDFIYFVGSLIIFVQLCSYTCFCFFWDVICRICFWNGFCIWYRACIVSTKLIILAFFFVLSNFSNFLVSIGLYL